MTRAFVVPHMPRVCENRLLEPDEIYQALPIHLHIAQTVRQNPLKNTAQELRRRSELIGSLGPCYSCVSDLLHPPFDNFEGFWGELKTTQSPSILCWWLKTKAEMFTPQCEIKHRWATTSEAFFLTVSAARGCTTFSTSSSTTHLLPEPYVSLTTLLVEVDFQQLLSRCFPLYCNRTDALRWNSGGGAAVQAGVGQHAGCCLFDWTRHAFPQSAAGEHLGLTSWRSAVTWVVCVGP